MMKEYISDITGAKIVINSASFMSAFSLQQAILKAYANSNVKFDKDEEMDMMAFFKFVSLFASDEDVIEAIFSCLIKSTYKGQKITKNTFEEYEARSDFYDIVFSCLEVNVRPFLQGLVLGLKRISEIANINSQK